MATGFSVMDALNKNAKAGIDEGPKARFRTKDISIHKMYRNKMNFYDLGGIEELAGDILMYGLKQNLELVYEPCEFGEYRIVAGERRWLALKMLVEKGYKEFEMATSKLTTPQDTDEEQVEIIIANAYRTKTIKDTIEEEQRLKASLERMKASGKKIKGYDLQTGRLRDVISAMLHMSKTKIAQIESVSNNLIPEFKQELNKERLTFSAAYELAGMQQEEQRKVLEKYIENGEITHKEIKDIKEGKEEDTQEKEQEEKETMVSEVDTEEREEYTTPHPEGITSICYSCTEYEVCNVKNGTCTKCDKYKNREEENKTDEQRYNEEQDAIDKETKKKLQELEQERKMATLPSDTGDGRKQYELTIASLYFDDVVSGKKPFELRKDEGYKDGDLLKMKEFKNGVSTNREIDALVTYVVRNIYGIKEGFCILGTKVIAVYGIEKATEIGERKE